MKDTLLLSRNKLRTFLECQRRFQLRYVHQMPWPAQPTSGELSLSLERGRQFHRLLEQHFLGFPAEVALEADSFVQSWWAAFQKFPPALPDGKCFPEMALSVPIAPIDGEGGHYLFGRFDLIILSETQATIFDWKTERKPRSASQLRADWQTRLYLALVVEGAVGLGFSLKPEQVAITYWFAQTPEQPVTIRYDQHQHAQNMAELKALVERIDRRLVAVDAVWPLTESLDSCRFCEFRSFCGRDVVKGEAAEDIVEMVLEDQDNTVQLEPVPANTL